MFHQFLGTVSFVNILGKNSQIAHFRKLCCNLLLFRKYVRIYHFLGTQIWRNWVFYGYHKKFSKFFRVYFFKELNGPFGSLFWVIFWTFQIHLYIFSYTFSSTYIKNTQIKLFKLLYQTPQVLGAQISWQTRVLKM